MQKTSCIGITTLSSRVKPLAIALSAAMMMCSTAYAASFGHSRMVSNVGQPLRIEVPVSKLNAQDRQSLTVTAAPAAAWTQAGLHPPVDLASLQFQLVDGVSADSKIIQVRSDQVFVGPVADLLLNVHTATGQQQYQVSVLANGKVGVAPPAASVGASSASEAGRNKGQGAPLQDAINVKRGDTLFAIARRHSVTGVSVYQMMVALQRANPQAFINGNINLVKAGALLTMPDAAALTAVSDREARRIFQQQAQAFATYRQGLAASKVQAVSDLSTAASKGTVTQPLAATPVNPAPKPQDQVVLSSGTSPADKAADDATASRKSIADSQERVSQLERNVKSLSSALQSQGEAAKEAVVDGAKTIGQSISDAANAISGDGSQIQQATNSQQTTPQSGMPTTSAQSSAASSGDAVADAVAGTKASENGVDKTLNSAIAAPGSTSNAVNKVASDSATNAASKVASDPTTNVANNEVNQVSSKANQPVSWMQKNLLGIITALLALIVLIIAWALRRANSPRDRDYQGGPITEAMVKEQLDKINLDLSQPPSDEPPVAKS